MSMTAPLSDLLPTYSKENPVLAPLMNYYSNVETNVHALHEADESYTHVSEILPRDYKIPHVSFCVD